MPETASRHAGFALIELMIVVAIIGILAAIAIPQFSAYRNRAYETEGYTLFEDVKKNISEFYDYRGFFPKNNEEAGLASPENIKGKYVESITVDGGVVKVKFYNEGFLSNNLKGKILTFRPAVSKNNPTGSVLWVKDGSSKHIPSGYVIIGKANSDS